MVEKMIALQGRQRIEVLRSGVRSFSTSILEFETVSWGVVQALLTALQRVVSQCWKEIGTFMLLKYPNVPFCLNLTSDDSFGYLLSNSSRQSFISKAVY